MKTKDIKPETKQESIKQEVLKQEKYISYIPRSDLKQFAPKRVVVYSRVSREGELKHHSIEMQKEHLEQYVASHPGWIFTGHYVDEGVTGTKLNRPASNQMMEDARVGKIDIILTKTVSRFGRNIAAVLDTIRELRELDVTVIFDNEQLSTANLDSNFQLQYQGIQAEVESRQNSEYQKWAIRNKFKQGIPTTNRTYGYRMENNQFYVVPEEAEVIKRIFKMYLSGMGLMAIAKSLNDENIPTINEAKWRQSTLNDILNNEKYTGDLLLQKTYRDNHLTKKKKKNHGELPKYLIENNHEAIISKKDFESVQKERERRKRIDQQAKEAKARLNSLKKSDNTGQHSEKLFTHLIRCANCKTTLIYKHITCNEREIWICRNYLELGKDTCPNKAIPENILTSITTQILLDQRLIKKDKQGNTPELTNELLTHLISKIIAYPDQTLEFHLMNGEVVTKPWQFISRRESWTPEMKQKAREKTLARNAKKKKENRRKGGKNE